MLYRHLYSCCSALLCSPIRPILFPSFVASSIHEKRTEQNTIIVAATFLLARPFYCCFSMEVLQCMQCSELLSRTPQLSPLEILRWMAAASFSSVDDDEEKKNRGSKCFPSTFTIFLIQPIFKSKISMSPKMELYGCLKWNPLKIRKENPQSTNWLSPNTMYFLNGHTVWNIVNYVLIFKNVHNTSQCFNYFVPCTRKQIVFQSSTI